MGDNGLEAELFSLITSPMSHIHQASYIGCLKKLERIVCS